MEGCIQIPVNLTFPAFSDICTAGCKDSMVKVDAFSLGSSLSFECFTMSVEIVGSVFKKSLMQGQCIDKTCSDDKKG